MNWAIKIISKSLITKILHISWEGYDKGWVTIKDFVVYLASMSSTDGSVSSKRYKNTFWMDSVDGLVTSGSNIIVATQSISGYSYVLIYNIETTEFIVKSYGNSLNWLTIEPETER